MEYTELVELIHGLIQGSILRAVIPLGLTLLGVVLFTQALKEKEENGNTGYFKGCLTISIILGLISIYLYVLAYTDDVSQDEGTEDEEEIEYVIPE